MRLRPSIRVATTRLPRSLLFAGALAAALFLGSGPSGLGETVRVSAWNWQDAGHAHTLHARPDDQRITVCGRANQAGLTWGFILAQPTVYPVPQRPRASVMGRYRVTSNLELDPAGVLAVWTTRAREPQLRARATWLAAAAAAPPRSTTPLPTDPDRPPVWWWFLGGAMAMALVFLLWFISRTARRVLHPGPPLLVDHTPIQLTSASSYNVVVWAPPQPGCERLENPDLPTPSVFVPGQTFLVQVAGPEETAARRKLAHLISRWLKQRFVRRLIADRAGLLATQHTAASKARAVEERLAQIEKQLQQQTSYYERRIEELTRELAAAREENREFIRARIAQVKDELEDVRTRIRAQTRDDADFNRT